MKRRPFCVLKCLESVLKKSLQMPKHGQHQLKKNHSDLALYILKRIGQIQCLSHSSHANSGTLSIQLVLNVIISAMIKTVPLAVSPHLTYYILILCIGHVKLPKVIPISHAVGATSTVQETLLNQIKSFHLWIYFLSSWWRPRQSFIHGNIGLEFVIQT